MLCIIFPLVVQNLFYLYRSIEFITLSVIHGLFIALRIVDLGIESLQVLSIALEKVSKKELKFAQSGSDPMRELWLST